MVLLFGGLLLLAFGAFMLFAPEQFFALTESWKSNTPSEPSDLFILSTRIGGVFFYACWHCVHCGVFPQLAKKPPVN